MLAMRRSFVFPLLTCLLTVLECCKAGVGSVGVDLSVATDTSTWECVREELVRSSPSSTPPFAIVRAYRNIGEVDENAPHSLHVAHNSGFRRFSGYIFPCVESSPFAQSRDDIECVSAEQQLVDTIDFLSSHDIKVMNKNESNIHSNKPTIQRLYLDIEDESPSKYFDPDTMVNQKLVADFVAAANARGVPLGFYTTSTYWKNIMNNTALYSDPKYPLWYPRWDATNSMSFFQPFGGWEDVLIKQTAGDVAMCGISQVDTDYMELS